MKMDKSALIASLEAANASLLAELAVLRDNRKLYGLDSERLTWMIEAEMSVAHPYFGVDLMTRVWERAEADRVFYQEAFRRVIDEARRSK